MAVTAEQRSCTTSGPGGKDFNILDDNCASTASSTPSTSDVLSTPIDPVPLVSSKMVNLTRDTGTKNSDPKAKSITFSKPDTTKSSVDTLLDRLNDQKLEYEDRKKDKNQPPSSTAMTAKNGGSSAIRTVSGISRGITKTANAGNDTPELVRLKKELDAAKAEIARQDQELCRARAVKDGPTAQAINCMQDAYAAQRPSWATQDDARSDVSDAMSTSSFPAHHRASCMLPTPNTGPNAQSMSLQGVWPQNVPRPFVNRAVPPSVPALSIPQGMRSFVPQMSPISPDSNGSMSSMAGYSVIGNRFGRGNRGTMGMNSGSTWSSPVGDEWPMIHPSPGAVTPMQSPAGLLPGPVTGYQPRPIGAPPSTGSSDFGGPGIAPWLSRATSPSQHAVISSTEPLNYRRLLDKSASCDWKYIVDKIVHNHDQQASIFLQQKLKVGTAQHKFEIVQSILAKAFPLMINRFGNFLVQRCFEHGTPEQVIEIANAIRGNVLRLSMDPFGCHVIQKAFDAVPEDFKAVMVSELLRRIPETVVHRYACHVWQKLFELRWNDAPPQIMKYVNEALSGMWHEVALGETGSLVVQNIFENCLEEDKRPCIDEVLNSIDIVAHGQFGNWCIQHICEHGAPADRTHAIDHVLKYATEYSMDQFASKVIEKCLKIGGAEFLDRYLTRVCEGRSDRPRIPLIDIASDQYGNYLIQYILTHAGTHHRELVASHIRKHMVSLRGSKFGSRVGMLCSNPTYATRAAVGMGPTQRFQSPNGTPGFAATAQASTAVGSSAAPGGPSFVAPISNPSSRYASNFH